MVEWRMTPERGFLPPYEPLSKCPPGFEWLDDICCMLPHLLNERGKMRRVAFGLPEPTDAMIASVNTCAGLERIKVCYDYILSAAYHAPHEPHIDTFPRNIALPSWKISQRVKKLPILSYDAYQAHNWKRRDVNKPIELGAAPGTFGNLELINHFDRVTDEDWFVLIHTAIEAKAGRGLARISWAQGSSRSDMNNWHDVALGLTVITETIHECIKILRRMPEGCSPDIYFAHVRPWIFSLKKFRFEGVPFSEWIKLKGGGKSVKLEDDERVTLYGETGAQSAVILAFLATLDLRHKATVLTDHLEAMRGYMPLLHRQFIEGIEMRNRNGCSIRDYVKAHMEAVPHLRTIYNNAAKALREFRCQHFEYADAYIHQRVANREGTGGTDFMPWFSQLAQETEEQLLFAA